MKENYLNELCYFLDQLQIDIGCNPTLGSNIQGGPGSGMAGDAGIIYIHRINRVKEQSPEFRLIYGETSNFEGGSGVLINGGFYQEPEKRKANLDINDEFHPSLNTFNPNPVVEFIQQICILEVKSERRMTIRHYGKNDTYSQVNQELCHAIATHLTPKTDELINMLDNQYYYPRKSR